MENKMPNCKLCLWENLCKKGDDSHIVEKTYRELKNLRHIFIGPDDHKSTIETALAKIRYQCVGFLTPFLNEHITHIILVNANNSYSFSKLFIASEKFLTDDSKFFQIPLPGYQTVYDMKDGDYDE
jgi:hypothetical protein